MKIYINAKKNPVCAVAGKLIRGDQNTALVHICIPRRADGVDLGGLAWAVNIENAAGKTDVYIPGDVSTDDSAIRFTWHPAGIATAKPGITRFEIEGTGGTVETPLVWQSAAYILKIEDDLNATPDAEDLPLDVLNPENAGKLLCIAPDGRITAISLGPGLAIENNALVITGAVTTNAAVCGQAVCGAAICGKE